MDTSDAAALMQTGVPNLDRVLGGGLPRGGLAIVLGPPGSGKTVLTCQAAFAAARRGERVLLLTVLSEPTTKLVEHLRHYEFFRPELIGDRLHMLSLQEVLARGLAATEEAITAEARRLRADMVLVDGFRGVRGVDETPQAARELLYDVGTTLSLQGATTLITSEADPRDPAYFAETTTADVILGMYFDLDGMRHRRRLEVIKVRGRAPLPGRHTFVLDDTGCTVFPRLEALSAPRRLPTAVIGAGVELPPTVTNAPLPGRAAFGMPELDALLHGGLTRQTSTLLAGSLGTGKTLLGLHFALAGVAQGEPTVYLGFRETAAQLLHKADAFALGQQLRRALAPGGNLIMVRWEPVDLEPDQVADQLLAQIDAVGARRLVIDSIAELQRAVEEGHGAERTANFLAALLASLRSRNVTVLCIRELAQAVAPQTDFSAGALAVLAENVLLLQQIEFRGGLHRVLAVVKMRFSAHDATLREFRIAPPEGIYVRQPFETGWEQLVGLAQRAGLLAGLEPEANRPAEGQAPPE